VSLYYQDDHVTLYHDNCLEMAVWGWQAGDVLVTDPPYGMSYQSNFNRDRRNIKVGQVVVADTSTDARDAVIEMWSGKPALVFGHWREARPCGTVARLVWDRGYHGMGDLKFPWGPADEEIYVLGKGFTGVREPNILRVHALTSRDARRPDHPTPKPVPLMERLIQKCPPGVIADPFAGSGSTLIAARNLGRKAIGVEIEERYCEIIARRLDQGCLELWGGRSEV